MNHFTQIDLALKASVAAMKTHTSRNKIFQKDFS
jgi:hypothetical protein